MPLADSVRTDVLHYEFYVSEEVANKAVALVAENKVRIQGFEGMVVYADVKSLTSDTVYWVSWTHSANKAPYINGSCDCKAGKTGQFCSHILATILADTAATEDFHG